MEVKDYFTIGLSSSALVVTIFWNLQNRWHTDRVAKSIRADSFNFEEWKSKRTEILRTLRNVEAAFDSIAGLSGGTHHKKLLNAELEREGRALTFAHGALMRELERAGPKWPAFGYGDSGGDENDWDQVHTLIGNARSARAADTARATLKAIPPFASSISRMLIAELDVVTAEHYPQKL